MEEEKVKLASEQLDDLEEEKTGIVEKVLKQKKIDLIPPRPKAANILQYQPEKVSGRVHYNYDH